MGCGGAVPQGSPGHGALPPFPGMFSRSARGGVSEFSSARVVLGLLGGCRLSFTICSTSLPKGKGSAGIRDKKHSQKEASNFLLHPCRLSLKDWSLLESFLAAPMETVHSRAVPQICLEAMPAP